MAIFSPIFICILFALLQNTFASEKIEASLLKSIEKGASENILMSFKTETQHVLNQVNARSFANIVEKRVNLIQSLKSNTASSQSRVQKFLDVQGVDFRSFWISNILYIKNASPSLVQQLAAMSEVDKIEIERIMHINDKVENMPVVGIPKVEDVWGIQKIQAPKAWAEFGKGKGMRVGVMDTGARGTHEQLTGRMAPNGWLDEIAKSPTPIDENSHGTHCTGTSVGLTVGVAPEASWLHCRAADGNGSFPGNAIMGCAQYMLAPTDVEGKNADASKAPHVINNSWGAEDDWYYQYNYFDRAIEAWFSAGIVPVFANGNSGPLCNTVGYPASNKNVIAVGNTEKDDSIAPSSSKGPSKNRNNKNGIKPFVSAPGTKILSSWHDGDSNYNAITGTSMAAPHIAGVVALILEQRPKASIQDVANILAKSVDTNELKRSWFNCGRDENILPSNVYGFGRINAYKAASMAKNM